MSDIRYYGVAPSSYVRTVRMAAVEKAIEHELVELEVGKAQHLELHPYGKVPILEHEGWRLYETAAILRYLDRTFDGGTALFSEDAKEQARGEQWISAFNCYMYDNLIPNYALQYIFGGPSPKRETIDSAVPLLTRDLNQLERGLADSKWLSGSQFGAADLVVAPAIQTAINFPEAAKVFETLPKLKAWFGAVSDRASAEFIAVPQG